MVGAEGEDARAGVSLVPFSVIALMLLRQRRLIVQLASLGTALGVLIALLLPRQYQSQVVLLPQRHEGGLSGLAVAASQFGIRVPAQGDGWSSALYAELLGSRTIMEPLAAGRVTVAELGGRELDLAELLAVESSDPAARIAKTLRRLRSVVRVSDDEEKGIVRVVVRTRWASVSEQIAARLALEVDRFNAEALRSQARAEREFVEKQHSFAREQLRVAEDRLEAFLKRNRAIEGAAELRFERDRLQREVDLRQQILVGLSQSLEDARIREVRDTPVITQIESARLALEPEPRGTVVKSFLGLVIGITLAATWILVKARLEEFDAADPEGMQEIQRYLPFVRRVISR